MNNKKKDISVLAAPQFAFVYLSSKNKTKNVDEMQS